jgi:hypothetical protein
VILSDAKKSVGLVADRIFVFLEENRIDPEARNSESQKLVEVT